MQIIPSFMVSSLLIASSLAIAPHPIKAESKADILSPSADPWYTAPKDFENAAPGAILRLRPAQGNLTGLTSNSSAAYNILYRTTNSRYRPAWAVTTLFVPSLSNSKSNASSTARNKLLSYQIPYDSADVDASPSYALYTSPEADISAALGQGWYVNVPDYEGPLASFTAGVQSGHATLDSVRAILNSGFGLSSGSRYALWGYSGGALASEWAAELQVQYAPELNFVGAALGGLTPNVTSVLESITGTPLAGLAPSGILGLASQYPELELFLQNNLKRTGKYNSTGFFAARNLTLLQSIGTYANQNISDYFTKGLSILQESVPKQVTNSDGIMGFHGVPQMPIFAYKAIKDEISRIEDTDRLVNRYCEVNGNIWYQRNTVGDHSAEAVNGDARAFKFLVAVLGGTYRQTGCKVENVTVTASTV